MLARPRAARRPSPSRRRPGEPAGSSRRSLTAGDRASPRPSTSAIGWKPRHRGVAPRRGRRPASASTRRPGAAAPHRDRRARRWSPRTPPAHDRHHPARAEQRRRRAGRPPPSTGSDPAPGSSRSRSLIGELHGGVPTRNRHAPWPPRAASGSRGGPGADDHARWSAAPPVTPAHGRGGLPHLPAAPRLDLRRARGACNRSRRGHARGGGDIHAGPSDGRCRPTLTPCSTTPVQAPTRARPRSCTTKR